MNVWGFWEFHKLGIRQCHQIVVSPVWSPPKCTVYYSEGVWISFMVSAGIDWFTTIMQSWPGVAWVNWMTKRVCEATIEHLTGMNWYPSLITDTWRWRNRMKWYPSLTTETGSTMWGQCVRNLPNSEYPKSRLDGKLLLILMVELPGIADYYHNVNSLSLSAFQVWLN